MLRKQLKRDQMAAFCVNLSPLAACGSALFWARKLQELGHTVRLMAPQCVKPYLNDLTDAEAICEAVARPNMRFVAIKTDETTIRAAGHEQTRQYVPAYAADPWRTRHPCPYSQKGRIVGC